MDIENQSIYGNAETEYIFRWGINAKQHFDDGDYNWLCDFIYNNAGDVHSIIEIGCGAGYSTLAFAQNSFDVIAVDIDPQAIEATKQLMQKRKTQNSVSTIQGDIIHQMEAFVEIFRTSELSGDLIVLCNPGGNFVPHITIGEKKLLCQFGFDENEINQKIANGETPLLHKWALIYAASMLSKQLGKKLVLVERGKQTDLPTTLKRIRNETGARIIATDFRNIRNEPQGGIELGNADTVQYWGVALYSPAEVLANQEGN